MGEDRRIRGSAIDSEWLLATFSGRAGLVYLLVVTGAFLVGILMAALLRVELLSSATLLVSPESYRRLFSGHGATMLFLVALPAIPGVLGNLNLPRMLGIRELAFARLNLAGALVFAAGTLILIPAIVVEGSGSTWMMLPGLAPGGHPHSGILLPVGQFMVTGGLLALSLSLFVTIGRRRHRTTRSLFAWSLFIASGSLLLALPVLLSLALLRMGEVSLGWAVFDSTVSDPLLYRRLFLAAARPAFYAAAIPAFGLLTEIFEAHSGHRSPLFRSVVASFFALAVLGHLGAAGSLGGTAILFDRHLTATLAGYLTLIPGGLILGNWAACLAQGPPPTRVPMAYAMGAVLLLVSGGIAGLVLRSPVMAAHLRSTLFSVGHLHYLLAGTILMSYLGGMHHWWSSLTGRTYSKELAVTAAVLIFTGIHLTFLPQLVLGYSGLPRRLPVYPGDFQMWHVLSTAGMTLLVIGYLLPLVYLVRSLLRAESEGAELSALLPQRQEPVRR